MSENFRIIKRKYLITAVIVSIILGVLCGIAVACTLAVAFKVAGVEFFWAFYIPIAIVVAAGFSGLFFLILKPKDKNIAKTLDGKYGFNQKVQTMVEFAAEDGAMVRLQREQTDEALATVVKKRADLSWLWKFLFIPVIAVAMLFCGIFVPANKSGANAPYDITLVQKTALTTLINETKSSDLEENLKASTVDTLNELLNGLESAQTQGVMRKAVISAVSIIDNLAANANSYLKIVSALRGDDELVILANYINYGATFFLGNTSSEFAVTSFETVKSYAASADGQITALLDSWKEGFNTKLHDSANADVLLTVTKAAEVIESYSNKIKTQLARTPYSKGGDALANALYAFTEDLDKLVSSAKTSGENLGTANYNGSILGACTNFENACVEPLCVQSYNCTMDLYIRHALAKIFGISMSEFGDSPALAVPPTESTGKPGSSQGGANPGEEIEYAGNDLVLDKDTGELVPYGQLYDKYRALVDDYITDTENPCPEELAIYIRQYFQLLFNGIEDKKGN
ncbi:MAG: hypothetical protein K2O67_00750 [Clostridia bacterium]|nr:hypothetical protein [Clostridia bacterium]